MWVKWYPVVHSLLYLLQLCFKALSYDGHWSNSWPVGHSSNSDRILTIHCRQTICSRVSPKCHPPTTPVVGFLAPSLGKQQKEKPSDFGCHVSNCGKRVAKPVLFVCCCCFFLFPLQLSPSLWISCLIYFLYCNSKSLLLLEVISFEQL